MKLTNVSFNDDEEPQEATFVLTVDEAALLYAMVGHIAPKAITDASGDARWGNALYDVADCLADSFFNRFWDAGASEVAPRLTLNVGVPEGAQ